MKTGQNGLRGRETATPPSATSTPSTPSTAPAYPESAANGALALIAVASRRLDRELAAQAEALRREGGFTDAGSENKARPECIEGGQGARHVATDYHEGRPHLGTISKLPGGPQGRWEHGPPAARWKLDAGACMREF